MKRLTVIAFVAIMCLNTMFVCNPAGTHHRGEDTEVCSLMGEECPHHKGAKHGATSTSEPALYCDCGHEDEASGTVAVTSAVVDGYRFILPVQRQPLFHDHIFHKRITISPPEQPPRSV